ncbi:MAG: hypothetical protein HYZ88_01950 [Candidatus Omnitrophica bacterium]|nr:hypothetical protein [Candidatus Omnitrophota bacterium]
MNNKAWWLLFAGLLAAGPVQAEEIRGRVVWQGPLPIPEKIEVKYKQSQGPESIKGCGHEKESPELQVDASGGVANVVVWVEAAGAIPPAQATVLLDQKACEFLPHVVAVLPGTRVAIRNSDQVVHSVRVFQEGKPSYLMNQWQKAKAPDLTWNAKSPGRYVVRCGVHLWMHAWIAVLPPSFSAVSAPSGEFQLAGFPAGRHRLHFWHETSGEWERSVEVTAGGLDLGTILFPTRKE